MRRAARGAALLLAGVLAACRGAQVPSEPRVERAPVTSPAELFPDDLDFVVRVGAARIRQNPALAGVVREIAKQQPSDLVASMQSALGDAAAVWAGTRWMSDGFHGDGVVAIETAPGSEASTLADARGAEDARGAGDAHGWRLVTSMPLSARASPTRDCETFERAAGGRADAVLRVVMNGHGILLATAAEADAVLRVLRAGPDRDRLEPPERGLLSFAGRPRTGSAFDTAVAHGTLRGVMEGLVGYSGVIDEGRGDDKGGAGVRSDEGIDLDASLAYVSSADAARAAERAKELAGRLALAGGALGRMANSMKLTEVGTSVQLRLKVPFAWLAELH